jgi:hypothetical protein
MLVVHKPCSIRTKGVSQPKQSHRGQGDEVSGKDEGGGCPQGHMLSKNHVLLLIYIYIYFF